MLAPVLASGTMALRGLPYVLLFYAGALVLALVGAIVGTIGAVYLAIAVYKALTDQRPRDGQTVEQVEGNERRPPT